VIGLLLGRFLLAGRDQATPPVAAAQAPAGDAQATVASLQNQLRAKPDNPDLLTKLGVSYITRARETADPSYYTKAAEALERSQSLGPDRPLTLTGLGLLALSRHDFPAALDYGRRAHAIEPASPEPLGVMVDAQIELGRYDEAAETAQDMLDRRPSLASLSRASYLRELNGDVPGAITAMTQAVVAGAGSAADVAYVQVLLGDLQLGAGDLAKAETAYRQALDRQPAYGAAEVGLARVSAARGDIGAAGSQLDDVVARLPQPAYLALAGDIAAVRGHGADATAQYDLVRQIEALNRANGVAVDLELARFEADHARDPGANPEGAVALARVALAQRPTIFAEDTLGWALRQTGRPDEGLLHARAAVRLGTADALLWYHLAAIEADSGQVDAARADLSKALAINRYLTPRDLPNARSLAARLGISA